MQYRDREIQAESLEFHEDVEFHNCVIHAGKILAFKGAMFNNTAIYQRDDIEIEVGKYWELKDRPFARLLVCLRRLLRQLWAGSAVVVCPECYMGGGWEPGACEGCKARGSCQKTVLLP